MLSGDWHRQAESQPTQEAVARAGLLVWGRVTVCGCELGADLVGVGMLQVVKDGERLLPGLPGLRQLARGVAGVAEVGEGVRFIEAVAGFPVQAERALVAGGGFGEVAQMVLGVSQAVPDISLEPAVADFRAQGECLAAERAGLLVVAEEAVAPADVVERCRPRPPCRRWPGTGAAPAQRARARRRSGPGRSASTPRLCWTLASPRRLPSRWYSVRLLAKWPRA